MNIERLNELLAAYADNFDRQNELNEEIFEPRGLPSDITSIVSGLRKVLRKK